MNRYQLLYLSVILMLGFSN